MFYNSKRCKVESEYFNNKFYCFGYLFFYSMRLMLVYMKFRLDFFLLLNYDENFYIVCSDDNVIDDGWCCCEKCCKDGVSVKCCSYVVY